MCIEYIALCHNACPGISPVSDHTTSSRFRRSPSILFVTEDAAHTSEFAKRVIEQLEEKRKNCKTLTDVENLLDDEKKYVHLLSRNTDRLVGDDRRVCGRIVQDAEALLYDHHITNKLRNQYRAERVANPQNLEKLGKFLKELRPHPDLRVEGVIFRLDDIEVVTNKVYPELCFRLKEALIYFARLVIQHCNLSDPTIIKTVDTFRWSKGKRYEYTPQPMGIHLFEVEVLRQEKLITRIPSREHLIFNPDRSYHQEYARIVQQYIEESFADPANFKLADHLLVVPQEEDSWEARVLPYSKLLFS